MSKSLEELARAFARAQGQPADKEEDSETSDDSGPLPLPKSAWVVSLRQHHHLRMLTDHLMGRDGKSVKMRTLAARRNDQTALRTFLEFVEERALLWSTTSKSTVPRSLIEKLLCLEFSITMVHSFLLP